MSAYSEAVLEEANLLFYAQLDGSATTEFGTAELEVTGATFSGEGPLPESTALVFDGKDDFATLDIDLTLGTIGSAAVTSERFLQKAAFANDDALEFEYGTNYNTAAGFMSDPNGSGGGFEVALRGSSGPVADSFPRPAAGQWHHLATVYDAGAAEILQYLNGDLVETTSLATNTPSTFNDNILYIASRAGTSLFSAQRTAHLALYAGALSAERVAAHFAAVGGQGTSQAFISKRNRIVNG